MELSERQHGTVQKRARHVVLVYEEMEGQLLQVRSGPGQPTRVSAIHHAVLSPRGEPGGRLAFVIDVSTWVKIPDPGRYTVVAKRVPFGRDRHQCQSNSAELVVD